MEDLKFEYHCIRASEARFGVAIAGFVASALPWLATVLLLSGVGLIVSNYSSGWLAVGLAVVPYMLHMFYRYHIIGLKSNHGNGVSSILSKDVLGKLPKNPTPKDIATASATSKSGLFLAMRFGLVPNVVQSLSSDDPSTTADIWKKADEIRKQNNMRQITGGALIVAIIRSFPDYQSILAQTHLDDEDLDMGLKWRERLRDIALKYNAPRRTGGIARDWTFGYIPLLTHFGQNISDQMSRGNRPIPISVGSHLNAVDQLVDTFSHNGKQNALLVGQVGVGKTAIIYDFANKLLDSDSKIASSLRFRQVFILDSASLISEAPGRGELEGLMLRILSEAHSAKNIILCLDNAQLFFEEGVGSVDLSNVLQPILEAGNLRMILSMDEQKYLEINQRSPGLIGSLNRINVPTTDEIETEMIMQEQVLIYEAQRNVVYMHQSLKEAYRLSERYIHDIGMPGRALKLLEASASYNESGAVTVNSVQQAIEKTMDIKVSVASDAEDRERLLNMEDLIHQRMVNQTRAVSVVSDALRRARAGVRNPNRPIGTFLFLGPTGVGKTELSKALAEVYFGGEDRIVRVDLNEYVRPDDVMRLIADGASESGSLTAKVMKQPFSVVLLDEIEKAAPEVLATLLQLLDEGILRDEKGREVSFRDAILIATSNAGADRIREYIDRGYEVSQFEKQFVDELISSNQFRPEFLNRFDEIVVFRPFTKEELIQICDLILAGVNKTLALQKVSVVVEQDAKILLVEHGYDPRLGARPMRRVIQKAVENTVARQVLSGQTNAGGTVTITAEQVEAVFATESI